MDEHELMKSFEHHHQGALWALKQMGRPGITFTRWQRLRIWWWKVWGRNDKLLSVILDAINDAHKFVDRHG